MPLIKFYEAIKITDWYVCYCNCVGYFYMPVTAIFDFVLIEFGFGSDTNERSSFDNNYIDKYFVMLSNYTYIRSNFPSEK